MRLALQPHPGSQPAAPPFALWANIDHAAAFGERATLNAWFGIGAPMARFAVGEAGEGMRRDELWRTTCFEIFLRAEGEEAYREWNFAPSGDWAAYDFTACREGMRPAEVEAEPYIRTEDNFTWWALGATISIPAGRTWTMGVSAVLEERDGTTSHWALAHPGERPDFHHADCFAARLG